MYLIRAQENELLALRIENTVVAHHLMGLWDTQDFLSKFKIILDWLILAVNPRREEFLVELLARVRSDIARIAAIRHDKHLNHAEQATVLTLHAVFLDLPESIHKGVVLILQLDLNHRDAVDEKRYIETALAVLVIDLIGNKLVDDFIGRPASCYLAGTHGHQVNRTF